MFRAGMTYRSVARACAEDVPTLIVLALALAVVGLASILGAERRDAFWTRRAGQTAPAFSATSSSGRPVEVDYTGKVPTLLYYFSQSCGWCERNWPGVRAVAAGSRGRVRVIAITGEHVAEDFASKRHLEFEVLGDVPKDLIATLRLGATPDAVLVAPGGRIARGWQGAWLGQTRDDVARTFQVRLPSLAAPQR